MSLPEKDIAEIVRRSNLGEGNVALAKEFGVSEGTVRYHLNKQVRAANSEPAYDTDEDLGIDQEDKAEAPASDALTALMNDPKFAAVLDAAVAARVAQLGHISQAPADGENSVVVAALRELSKSFERSLEIQASQQPGYSNPRPREVVERRAAGYVEMTALIEQYKADGEVPVYILGDVFHGPSPNGPTLYEAGSEIGSYLPPAEHFQPQNEQAREIYAAMIQWIGGPSPEIGDRIIEAHADAKRVIIGADEPAPRESAVTLRQPPKPGANPLKNHAMAHVLTENPNNIPVVPGRSPARAAPAGPAYVG